MGESQEDATEHDCLKCGQSILQVPYKYDGKYFHARCLICSFCGKKLAGRPFLTDQSRIFCGDQCREGHQEQNKETISIPSPNQNTDSTNEESVEKGSPQRDESLLEVLSNAERTPPLRPHLSSSSITSSSTSTPPHGISLARITDYPGHSLSQSSLGSIRRLSLSMSESSLTSSMASESGSPGQPRKRILKKPHGPRKHKSNRVHWNIPEEEAAGGGGGGEGGEDEGSGGGGGGSDGVSLLSFESTSTTSGLSFSYQRARESVSESRRNWREFEEPPPPGSTGLTPVKRRPLAPLRETGEYIDNYYSSSSSSTTNHTHHTHHNGNIRSLSSSQQSARIHQNGMETGDIGTGPKMQSLFHTTHTGSTTAAPSHTSTPLRHHSNNSSAQLTTTSKSLTATSSAHSHASSSQTPPLAPPVLILDHSNLTDLESSTVEDRAKSNIFEFPKKSSSSSSSPGKPSPQDAQFTTKKTPPPPRRTSYSGFIPPKGHAHLYEDNDADDYDHLNPRNTNSNTNTSNAPTTQTVVMETKNIFRFDFFPQPSKSQSRRTGSSPVEPPGKSPPGKSTEEPHGYRDNDIDEAVNELTEFRNSRHISSRRQEGDRTAPPPPPPVPPKLRNRKSNSPNSGAISNDPSQGFGSGNHSSQEPSNTTAPRGGGNHHLPEFAIGPARILEWSEIYPEDGHHDDALSSVSTGTLVASEPGDSAQTPPSSSDPNTGSLPRPKSKKTRHVTTDLTSNSKTRSTSIRVHPETYPSHSASSSARPHQSWEPQRPETNGSRGGTFAPHPPPLRYQQQPMQSTYSHDSRLHPITEHLNPNRHAFITVSNSGSDTSLRGASPQEKISQAPVISTNKLELNYYSEDSLSQPLPLRPISASTTKSITATTARGPLNFSNQRNSQNPRVKNSPPTMDRNHRLYHSHRSGLAAPRPIRTRGTESTNVSHGAQRPPQRPPQQMSGRSHLKSQHSLDSQQYPHHNPIPIVSHSYSPPFQSGRALSQDDPSWGPNIYPSAGGQGLLPRPRIRSTEGILQRPNYTSQYLSRDHTYKPHPPSNGYPRKPHPSKDHTHHRHNNIPPQLIQKVKTMTSV